MILETIAAVNTAVNNFVWGIPAMVCIIGVGFCSACARTFADTKVSICHQNDNRAHVPKKDASDGTMTPFQAVCTALAGTVGTGNIAGVAGAIAIGGPGAVFWMWCAEVLGMCTKFAEVTLAVHYRAQRRRGVGRRPDVLYQNGLGRHWQFWRCSTRCSVC